jgi:hypothetical protein
MGAAGSGGNVPAGAAGAGSVQMGPAPCQGCLELAVPVTAPDQSASFRFAFDPPMDFSRASVTWRVQVPEASTNSNFFLTTDVQNSTGVGIFENYNVLSRYNFTPNEWVDLVVDVSAHAPSMVAGSFNYQAVALVVLTLGTTSTFSGTGTIRVLVDSVTFNGVPGLESSDFALDADGLELSPLDAPPGASQPIHHL